MGLVLVVEVIVDKPWKYTTSRGLTMYVVRGRYYCHRLTVSKAEFENARFDARRVIARRLRRMRKEVRDLDRKYREIVRITPWFLLYETTGESYSPNKYIGRTTDAAVAKEYYEKNKDNPYASSKVIIVTDDSEHCVNIWTDWKKFEVKE